MTNIPKHVAIVMDGNGRWAKKRMLPRVAGHRAGTKAVRSVIEFAVKHQVKVLSLFAFSTENWNRPKDEVSQLMGLLFSSLQKEVQSLHQNQVRLRVIGDLSALEPKIQQSIQDSEKLTENNAGLTLVLAINYGGQWDINRAAHRLADDIAAGKVAADDMDVEHFAKHLCLADLPPVDLFIRTSGELRISNFFLWQLAYAELYFPEILWPDFNEQAFAEALQVYSERQRRFGRV